MSKVQPRAYQLEVFEMSMKNNIIAVVRYKPQQVGVWFEIDT
jgi:hypothetical protein